MCHLGSFRIVLVALAVLTAGAEGFTIGRTTDSGAETPTPQDIDTRVTKIWPLDAVKLNELLENEIPSKTASSKSPPRMFLSIGAPDETQTPAANESTTYNPTATTAALTAEATAATIEDTKPNSTYESQSKISGIYSESSFTNTTSTQHETTTPLSDSIYTNILATILENESLSSSSNATRTLNVTSTEKNIFPIIFNQIKDMSISTSEVENENSSTSIGPVKNMSISTSEGKNENSSTSIAPVKNMSVSTSEVKNENVSTSTGAVKNISISISEVKNEHTSTSTGLVNNMSIITSEGKNENASTSTGLVNNMSIITSAGKNENASTSIAQTKNLSLSNESVNYNNSENVSVNSSQSDLSARDRKIYVPDVEKFNLFVDHSHFTEEAASSNEPVTIAEHIYETMSSIANTSIIDLDKINMSTTDIDNSNFTDITKTIPKTIVTLRGNVPLIGEKNTPADEIELTTKSASTTTNASEKINQDLMTPEANNTSYSYMSVEINDIKTTDTSSGNSSVTNNPEIRATTSTMPSVTETTPYTYLGSIGHNKDITTSFRMKFRNEITKNTPSSFHWKKYNVIDRSRANTEAIDTTTENFEILQGAGTAQGIEHTLRADQAYLHILENKLLSLDKMSTTESSTKSLLTYSNFTTELPPEAIEKSTNLLQSQPTKPNVVSSLRAGFLDFTSRTTTIAAEISSNKGVTSGNTDETTHIPEVKLTTMKTEPERANVYKSSLTTKSLDLVDDAIEEELMKEEIMFNSRELSWKATKGESPKTTIELADSNMGGGELTVRPISSEGSISSEIPLSSERPKLTGLYTVSPNYKRLKKIDVQAPKPFLRDPDDNSWRNESLSSRGIVFKANNSTKPFTQVLKNKTESVWNTILENYNKEQPALRERLEKVAEMRKSKKKKFNNFGEPIYTDYEESSEGQKSIERFTMPILTRGANLVPETIRDIARYTTAPTPTVSIKKQTTTSFDKSTGKTTSSRQYEYEDEDEEDYKLPNIDLKKFISAGAGRETTRTPPLPAPASDAAPARPTFPDRKPTLQYFPPRERATSASVVMNDYDVDFRNVVNQYTLNIPGKYTFLDPATPPARLSPYAGRTTPQETGPSARSSSLPPPPPSTTIPTPHNSYIVDTYNEAPSLPSDRGAYIVKHFRDFINEVINAEGTEEPQPERTTGEPGAGGAPPGDHSEYSDYEDHFRRHVLSRFMDNFNQNSERFKSEFPLLYNTSVVHAQPGAWGRDGEPEAESMAFMRRLYDDARAIQLAGRGAGARGRGSRGPPCDRTVELSPDYELHYYVPDGEEREEFQKANLARADGDPYRLSL